ncbi:ester cyclase [Rubellicoccus peritrichatus]|uniref:Ester cyclase n=1 Tax=Rubellicoccus peritrichatus TaxID=3080537 RepID=A0AAQ3LFI8_9BACT|nr:ester cyclase [Puniceicoccus sp. CR14]WOO42823.1 ester cyclase [Puniceicoccus sp. CR14]
MSLELNKQRSVRALSMWASDNDDKAEDLFTGEYVNHQEPGVEGGVVDKCLEEWKALVEGFHQSFSNAQAKILMQIAEGDLVSTRWEFTATHTGEFMGLAPTGNVVVWKGVQIDQHKDGMIIESWVDWDKYSFFEGIGLVGKA